MPDTFKNELINAVRNAFCTTLQLQQNYYGYIAEKFPFPTAAYARNFMGLAYRLACNREPPAVPTAPFTGGQCYTSYTVVAQCTAQRLSGTPPLGGQVTRGNVPGKITGTRVIDGFSGTFPVWIAQIVSVPANGIPVYTELLQASKDTYQSPVTTFTSITRNDGLPDNCGNPPIPTPTPNPGYNNSLVTINYTNNSSVNVAVNARFTFAGPIVKIDGSIRVPVRIDIGDVGVKIGGDINLNTGDVEINFGNNNYNPSDEPNPDTYRSPDDTPTVPPDVPTPVLPPSPDSSQPSTTTILRGCIVTVSSVSPTSTVIYQDGNPDIYAPNLGFVQFLIATGNSLAWTSDIPVKNKRNLIPCPWEGGALTVRGTPREGVVWSISPVYDKAENTSSFA